MERDFNSTKRAREHCALTIGRIWLLPYLQAKEQQALIRPLDLPRLWYGQASAS